jgi:hypothetical protein
VTIDESLKNLRTVYAPTADAKAAEMVQSLRLAAFNSPEAVAARAERDRLGAIVANAGGQCDGARLTYFQGEFEAAARNACQVEDRVFRRSCRASLANAEFELKDADEQYARDSAKLADLMSRQIIREVEAAAMRRVLSAAGEPSVATLTE